MSELCNHFEKSFEPNELRKSDISITCLDTDKSIIHTDNPGEMLKKSSLDAVNLLQNNIASTSAETLVTTNKENPDEVIAKMKELTEWSDRGVYDEVDNKGQNIITLRAGYERQDVI